MTQTPPQPPTENGLHSRRGANIGCAESADACALLVAELEARRVRIRKLLHLVRLAAGSVPARRVPIRPPAGCGIKRTA
jgi:hypothetical protein